MSLKMDSMKFWLKVLIMDYVFSMCLDLNCDWKTQYEHKGICCGSCPQGEFPMELCSATSTTLCKKCSAENIHANTRCSCSNETLCINSDCSSCILRRKCKRGEGLKRVGNFKFTYICKPCPDMTYNNDEDSTCKPITNCSNVGLLVLSAGNRTHNARCGCHADVNQPTSSIILAGFGICILICVALVINLCFQKITGRRVKKKCHPPMHSLVLKTEEPGCKLSKEEKGEICISHSYNDISSELSAEEQSLEV